jgi:hypothetical protein
MRRRRFGILLVLVCLACKQPPPKKPAAPAAGPQVRATVVTIRTTIQPENKTYTHTLVIARGRARSTDELDQWRLFDTSAKSVTFVDDVAKTVRTESLDSLLQRHRQALAAALPEYYPRARATPTGAKRPMHGVTAEETRIEAGAYRRELWLAEHRAIPHGLFAMMQASDGASSPLAPMMRNADAALTGTRAFPLLDHSELPYGKSKLVVDREVIAIREQNVPEALLSVPRGYRDMTVTKSRPSTPMKR